MRKGKRAERIVGQQNVHADPGGQVEGEDWL